MTLHSESPCKSPEKPRGTSKIYKIPVTPVRLQHQMSEPSPHMYRGMSNGSTTSPDTKSNLLRCFSYSGPVENKPPLVSQGNLLRVSP
ncbi:hypothetical protein PoB_002627200 [Plakobranchus ocellatus]|uniref:Uncharacterized protein n=1 Tax=Plakobranchus ocellatus TaxID=259542 RepID=A0AAV3ZXF9_9GAST|nr:hypothetical protein PoB_002627200 [Plakobranchus ocellatus]